MSLTALAAMIGLLLLNGFFVAAEFAFTAAAPHRLASTPGRSARAAVAAMEQLSFTLAGAQLGITIASLLLGAVAEPAVAALLETTVGTLVPIPEDALHVIALVVALLIVVFLHMVVGEMGPKNIAIAAPERSSRILALPFRLYSAVFRPVIWLLNEAANVVLRIVGIDPTESKAAHTADDLASLITAGRREGIVEEFAHRLLTGAIDLWDLRAEHVMVPRTEVVALPITATAADVERVVVERGFSRIPMYEDTLDNIRGFTHAKDLLRLDDDALDRPVPSELIRPISAIPASNRVGDLLERMRRGRHHLALVVGEYGDTVGIVTLEDIVEEVVGEIRDEHDPESTGIRRLAAGRFLVDAMLRLDEVQRACGADLPAGDYDTVGGLVMADIGRIPAVGDRMTAGDWTLEVRSMDGLRVGKVELIPDRRRGE